MIALFLAFILSFLATALIVPIVIRVSIKRRLFDAPSEARKVHKRVIPNLGGIAIFLGFIFCQQLFVQSEMVSGLNQLLTSASMLFMLGLKDDIIGLSPYKKFVAQFAAAFIVTLLGDIRIEDLGGVFGLHELSFPFSISLSVFVIVGVVNAFNLIDGIDGLAGVLGVIVTGTFAFLFYQAGDLGWAYLCLTLSGALIGFLIYNVTPASIFMGDSGALMIGFFAAVASIHFVNISSFNPIHLGSSVLSSAIGLAMALLIIPLFDTIRVFTLRIIGNRSPFEADQNHLHHRLIGVGMTHLQATTTLAIVTLAFLITAFLFQSIGSNQLIATLSILIVTLNTGFTLYTNSYEKRRIMEVVSEIAPVESLLSAEEELKPSTLPAHTSKEISKTFLEKIIQN